jgi:hypothetical protein
MTDLFNWNDDESVVLPQQAAIAVQGHEAGITLRQEDTYGTDDQYINVRRENVLAVCTAMLREAGHHRFMIPPVDEIEIIGQHGNKLKVPGEILEKLDRIAEEGRLEELASQTRWEPPTSVQPTHRSRDPGAAERKRRQRQKEREAKTVTVSQPVTPVTPRDGVTVTTAPRLPVELQLLQHGGVKQPVG